MPIFCRILPLGSQNDSPFFHHKYNKFLFRVLFFTLKKVQVVLKNWTTCKTTFFFGQLYPPYLVVYS